jgi:hypothetical protein
MGNIDIDELEKSFQELKNNSMIPESLNNVLLRKRLFSKPPKRKIQKRLVAIITLFLLLGGTVSYAIYPSIFGHSSSDKGLIDAENKKKVSYIGKSITKEGLKVTVLGVISDGIRTVISIKVEGKPLNNGIPNIKNIELTDSDGKIYPVSHWGQGDESSKSLFDQTIIEFNGSPKKATILTLHIKEINNVNQQWIFYLPITPGKIQHFDTNAMFKKGNLKININSVSFTSTYTILEGTYDNFDFANSAILSNGKEKVSLLQSEGRKDNKSIKLYFPPISPSNQLKLTVTDFVSNKELFTMEIPLSN